MAHVALHVRSDATTMGTVKLKSGIAKTKKSLRPSVPT